MKVLFIGGIKSGKSYHAERFALEIAKKKPCYVATTEFIDKEMRRRIKRHKKRRKNRFKTIEEPLKLYKTIKRCKNAVLVEDVSMWINNMLYRKKREKKIFKEIKKVLKLQKDTVFVINNVSESIIAADALSRRFVDINASVARLIADESDSVYETVAGILRQIK